MRYLNLSILQKRRNKQRDKQHAPLRLHERMPGMAGTDEQLARRAIDDPKLIPGLIAGMDDSEPAVRMCCASALEKVTRVRPEYLQPYADHLLGLLGPPQSIEILWDILQMTTRIKWPAPLQDAVFLAIEQCLANPSSNVKICAMQAMADLALQCPQHLHRVEVLLHSLSHTGTPATRSRGGTLLRAIEEARRLGALGLAALKTSPVLKPAI